MVLRRDAAGVLAVGQPAHARLCGQFARAWGNERFGAVEPLEEVALGAEQHDLAWGEWDLTPALNPDTGLPVSFLELDPGVAAELWRHGPPRLIAQSRWAALLATMHGRRLSELRDVDELPEPAATSVRTLRSESQAREAELCVWLAAAPELIARNSDLVWAWDGLSLALLLDWAPYTLRSVPAAGGSRIDLELRAVAEREGETTLSLWPWPFADPAGVLVQTEGRRLTATYQTETDLHAALGRAPWETVRFRLVPCRRATR
ncbi:MAG TPA: DUF3891 family protein [Solirubrobacteraceae bacterium]|nr:DUF3891 family protein [Solirubrobacteraceae bacterium]